MATAEPRNAMAPTSVAQETKQCEVCEQWKPATPEHFKPSGNGSLRAKCRACGQAEDRERWHQNKARYRPRATRTTRPRAVEDPALTLECVACGEAKPRTNEYFHYSEKADRKLANVCKVCRSARNTQARGTPTEYQAETPRDKAIVPDRTDHVTVEGRQYLVGWVGEATYWPVKPFVEAAGLDWSAQRQRIERDSELCRGVVTLTIPSPGGSQPMLCLPWSSWYAFWLGTNSPKVERFRCEAHEALALVFGDTAEAVLRDTPVAERVAAAGARLAGITTALSYDQLVSLGPWFVQRETALAAEQTAEADAAQSLAEAEQQLTHAATLRQQAAACETAARQRKADALAALDAARSRRQAIEAELQREYDRLVSGNVSYVYIHGPPDYQNRMLVDVKGGQTMNTAARDKALRAGAIKHRFLLCLPTETADLTEHALIDALCGLGGRRIGNDHVENIPVMHLVPFIARLSRYTVLTAQAIQECTAQLRRGRAA